MSEEPQDFLASLTDQWVEYIELALGGTDPDVFLDLGGHILPLGVDPNDPRVIALQALLRTPKTDGGAP
jgi:hypothetical protein